jgi:hypothetical protein
MNGKELEPVRANSIVAPDCPLTDADLAGVRVVRSQMLNGGYRPIAVHSPWSRACAVEVAGKAPLGKDWQEGQPRWRLFGDHPEWSRAGAKTGLLLGVSDLTLQALDFDINEVTVMAAVLATVKHIVPRKSLIRLRVNSPRVAMVLRCEPGALKEKLQGEHGAVERLATSGPRNAPDRRTSGLAQAAVALDRTSCRAAAHGRGGRGRDVLGHRRQWCSRFEVRSHQREITSRHCRTRGDIAVAFKACVTRCGRIVPAVPARDGRARHTPP